MALQRVGLLSPGDMGHVVGQVLVDQPVTAAWAVVGRVALEPLTVSVSLELLVEDAHAAPPTSALTAVTISFCCGNTPPKRRTLSMGGAWTPAWLSASRNSSSSWPAPASTMIKWRV